MLDASKTSLINLRMDSWRCFLAGDIAFSITGTIGGGTVGGKVRSSFTRLVELGGTTPESI